MTCPYCVNCKKKVIDLEELESAYFIYCEINEAVVMASFCIASEY